MEVGARWCLVMQQGGLMPCPTPHSHLPRAGGKTLGAVSKGTGGSLTSCQPPLSGTAQPRP